MNALELVSTWIMSEQYPKSKLPAPFIVEPTRCLGCGLIHKDIDGRPGADKRKVHCSTKLCLHTAARKPDDNYIRDGNGLLFCNHSIIINGRKENGLLIDTVTVIDRFQNEQKRHDKGGGEDHIRLARHLRRVAPVRISVGPACAAAAAASDEDDIAASRRPVPVRPCHQLQRYLY